MLQEEALVIAEKLYVDGFVASNGWLERFKNAHNISTMTVAGEEADVSPQTLGETGCFWKGLPDISVSEKGKRCSDGKQSKQRNTWAFFVNAAGGKENPVIIGHAVQPRCFKHLNDKKRPYGCYYFSNKKAWMTNDVMNDILTSLNQRLQQRQRTILLFLDNAPCHSTNLEGKFSNITLKFLPKNTTSKTQPLDSGIIASWKCKYKKRLLRHVCSKVNVSSNASEIVKSVDLLMSIEWGKQAWDEVSSDTIIKCFKRTGLYPEAKVEEDEDDPFEGEELSSLQLLVNSLNTSCPAQEFVCCDNDLEVCSGLIDPSDPEWRTKVREEVLVQNDQDPEIQEEIGAKALCVDDEEKAPEINSDREALQMAEKLLEYARYKGNEKLALVLSKSTDLLQEIVIRNQKQSSIYDYFKK